MALKALMLRKKIEEKKTRMEELKRDAPDFEKREEELEKAIEEAETEEEKSAVEEEVNKFSEEKENYEVETTGLQEEIDGLEAELEDIERKKPEVKEQRGERHTEMGGKRDMKIGVNIRALPQNVRALDALSDTDRHQIVEREDVKAFLAELRDCGKNKRSITGAELNIPVVLLDIISENMFRYSKLMNRVRIRDVAGQARQTIAGTVPEAIWTEMCGAINELNFEFNQITLDGYKVAGYVPVCNSILEDTDDINLASWIVEMLSESIGLAKDKAILYGKGATSNMPLGIVTRLAQTAAPTGYPANAPDWVDLSATNIRQVAAGLTGAEFWSQLMLATGNAYTPYARGRMFWAMNSKTLAMLKSKAITFTASGDVVANVYNTLPIITGDVDVLEFMPDGDIVGGFGDLYLWAQRADLTIDESTHVQFIQDNTVFRGKERADGAPVVPGAFVAINILGQAVTTSMTFAADKANDALLESLAIGTGTLTPAFSAAVQSYAVTASTASDEIEATAAQAEAKVEISYNGKNVKNGGTITWETGTNPVTITVKNGNAVRAYTVNVTKSA